MRAKEFITEASPRLSLRDFTVTISPHSLDQCGARGVRPNRVDLILKNLSTVKSSIMGLEDGSQFIVHDGRGTGVGFRKGGDNNLLLATVYKTPPGFTRGKHPTFVVNTIANVDEEVNPDIRHSEFKHELEIHGLRYTAETDNNSGYGNQLIIKVYDGKKEVANAEFYEEPHDKALISMNTWVISNYQGQNIATNMYAYAKMLGNDIMPSDTQTDQGERMWRSWNQSGQSKHILPKGQKGYREY
jgi:hypothetical protein